MDESARVTGAEAFVRCLQREGIDRVFGIPSGYLSPVLEAMQRAGIEVVTNLHECASSFAAAGYTMASGKLGVVYTQSGPGVLNAMTGVAAAYMDSVPQLLLATQAPVAMYARDAHQEATGANHSVDQLAAFTTAAAATFRPPTGEAMIRSTRRAFAAALGRRSTAVVEVGADLWGHKVDHADLAPEQYRAASRPVDTAAIAQLATWLRAAKQPVILVGHRAVHRGGTAALVALAEEQDVPVATVDFAKGAIPEDHPLCLGVLGSCGHDSAAKYLEHADLVIAIGTRMSSQTTFDFDAKTFPSLVHIDEIEDEPGRNLKLKLGIVSDVIAAIETLRTASGAPHERGSKQRVRTLRHEHGTYRTPTGRPSTSTPAVLTAIREVLPRETLVTGDSGLTLQYLKQFFPIYAPDGFFSLYSLASMGSGLPLAVGVQIARPDAPVLCVIGDGGSLVHLTELAVAAHLGLPLIVLICNNNGYKQVGDRMERYLGSNVGCALPAVDFVAAARAFGCDGYRAEDAESAAAAVRTAYEKRKTAVVEVRVKGDNLFDITPERIKKWWDRMFESSGGTTKSWPFPATPA